MHPAGHPEGRSAVSGAESFRTTAQPIRRIGNTTVSQTRESRHRPWHGGCVPSGIVTQAAGLDYGIAPAVADTHVNVRKREALVQAIDDLENEHKAIDAALGLLEQGVERLSAGDPTAVTDLDELLRFFRSFVDRCHLAKEEAVLFPALHMDGEHPGAGVQFVRLLADDHERARGLLRAAGVALGLLPRRVSAGTQLRHAVAGYVALLREHMRSEQEAFPAMSALLVAFNERGPVDAGFATFELEHDVSDVHEAYRRLVHRLHHVYVAPQCEPVGRPLVEELVGA